MDRNYFYAAAFFLLTASFVAAQTVPAASLGYTTPQTERAETKTSQIFNLTNGAFQTTVEIWRGDIVHITHRPLNQVTVLKSLSVIASPMNVIVTREETHKQTTLKTAKLQVTIQHADGCVSIKDLNGRSVVKERCGGTWVSSSVSGSANPTLVSGQKFVLDPSESLYGLGQHPNLDTLDLVGTTVQLLQRNGDVAVPVLLSSKGYLMLWDDPAITDVDVAKTDPHTVAWHSEAGFGADYYVALGPTPDRAIAGYRWLTGAVPMLPRWSWGFWQSRERYKTQEEILSIVAEYRKLHIPLDGIVQDWQYWPPLNQETAQGGWGSNEFDPSRYPDPAAMIAQLHKENAHLMVVSWAKFDVTNNGKSIANLQKLEAVHGVYEPAIPYVFPPGRGKWYDPFNPEARKVYWDMLSTHLFSLGVDAWWLDASEAELSGRWGEFRDFHTALGPGALVFNAYPLEHTRTVYEGQRSNTDMKRVVILTRSAYAGQQRNSAITWSGDIRSSWKVLQQQIPAGLNFVATGIPYWNTDTGGFFGSNPDDPRFVELFTRWFQFSTFCPMLRVHGTDKPKEVWRFDSATQKILMQYLELRYHLLPYIYSTSWQVTHNGYTMMRPLVMDFQNDTDAREVKDEYMFGPSLLVGPVTQSGVSSRSMRLPTGTDWVDFWTGKVFKGGVIIDTPAPIQTLPLYVKSGSILPYGPKVEYANEKPDAPVELRIFPGADGQFILYEDSGDGYGYERGAYSTIHITWKNSTRTLSLAARQGAFPELRRTRIFHVVLVDESQGIGVGSTVRPNAEIDYSGQAATLRIQ